MREGITKTRNWISYNLGNGRTKYCMANYVNQHIIGCWNMNESANYEKLLPCDHSIIASALMSTWGRTFSAFYTRRTQTSTMSVKKRVKVHSVACLPSVNQILVASFWHFFFVHQICTYGILFDWIGCATCPRQVGLCAEILTGYQPILDQCRVLFHR